MKILIAHYELNNLKSIFCLILFLSFFEFVSVSLVTAVVIVFFGVKHPDDLSLRY